jgi:hypothetical protein
MTDLAGRAQPGVVGTDGVGAPVAREIPFGRTDCDAA